MVRVRFAPSPTGNLHIGTLRTALFNWLFAKSQKGVFITRIEDTDLARSQREYEDNIYEGMNWMGLSEDEGPVAGGHYGPYRQSERIKDGIYQKIADELIEKGLAYYCFATDEQLDLERQTASEKGIPYKYSGQYKVTDLNEVKTRAEAGENYSIRFHIPSGKTVAYADLIKGDMQFESDLFSDFVIMKSDGTPSYNFAVVVDDHLMAITHVVRGEDHISNTPKQILIYEALGWTPPKFGHMPMILGQDRAKLSKRHGATSVSQYRDEGYLSDAMFNYLALLGWSSKTEQELFSRSELGQLFSLDGVSKSNAIFDVVKLKWMNGQYIRQLSPTLLLEAVDPFISTELKSALRVFPREIQAQMVASIQDNLELLADVNTYVGVYLKSEAQFQEDRKQITFTADDQRVLSVFSAYLNQTDEFNESTIHHAIDATLSELNLGKGKVLKPIRLAITAEQKGPNLGVLLACLGRAVVLNRLKIGI